LHTGVCDADLQGLRVDGGGQTAENQALGSDRNGDLGNAGHGRTLPVHGDALDARIGAEIDRHGRGADETRRKYRRERAERGGRGAISHEEILGFEPPF